MAFPTFTLITCILVLILVITTILAIVFYVQRNNAFAYVSPLCYNSWSCASTASTPSYNPVAAFVAVLEACKVDPATGNIDVAKCPCTKANWSQFYDPTDASKYSNPPSGTIPNNCKG